jgi:hypothetical protein
MKLRVLRHLRGRRRASLRHAEPVATALDKDKLHDVLDQAVIVIDERDLERSRKDPRVRAFHESSARLMAELEAEGANYD